MLMRQRKYFNNTASLEMDLGCAISILGAFTVMLAGTADVQGQETKGQEPPIQQVHPLHDTMVEKVMGFVEVTNGINQDYACWANVDYLAITPRNPDRPVERSTIVISAKHLRDGVTYSGTGLFGEKDNPLVHPLWMEVLVTKDGSFRKSGDSRQKLDLENANDKNFVSSQSNWCPVFRSLIDGTSVHMGNDNTDYIIRAFVNGPPLVDAKFDSESRNFYATWKNSGKNSSIEVTTEFGASVNYLPIKTTYILVEKEKRHLYDLSQTSWEHQGNFWVPTKIETIHEDVSGKSHSEIKYSLLWKVGGENLPQPPSDMTSDWKSVYCKHFEKECDDKATHMLRQKLLRGALPTGKEESGVAE